MPRLYSRKILRIGSSSYAISLPKEWVISLGLKEGMPIFLEETVEKNLLILPYQPPTTPRILKALLEVKEGEEESIERLLIAQYEAGYDYIRIVGKPKLSADARRAIKKTLIRLIGFEIIEESADYVAVQSVLDPETLDIWRTLDRMEVLILNMIIDLKTYLTQRDTDYLISIIERDDDVDKFYFLLSRQVNLSLRNPSICEKVGLENVSHTVPIYSYGKTLERIGDVVVSIARNIKLNGEDINLKQVNMLEESLKNGIRAFRKGEIEAMRKVSYVYNTFFSQKPPKELTEMLLGNFLSLCIDLVEARIVLDALKWPMLSG